MRRIFIPSEARDPYRFDMPLKGYFSSRKKKGIFL